MVTNRITHPANLPLSTLYAPRSTFLNTAGS